MIAALRITTCRHQCYQNLWESLAEIRDRKADHMTRILAISGNDGLDRTASPQQILSLHAIPHHPSGAGWIFLEKAVSATTGKFLPHTHSSFSLLSVSNLSFS